MVMIRLMMTLTQWKRVLDVLGSVIGIYIIKRNISDGVLIKESSSSNFWCNTRSAAPITDAKIWATPLHKSQEMCSLQQIRPTGQSLCEFILLKLSCEDKPHLSHWKTKNNVFRQWNLGSMYRIWMHEENFSRSAMPTSRLSPLFRCPHSVLSCPPNLTNIRTGILQKTRALFLHMGSSFWWLVLFNHQKTSDKSPRDFSTDPSSTHTHNGSSEIPVPN